MKKIGIVVGTRPEAIKLIPVFLSLKNIPGLNPFFISTGQHKEMLDQVFDVFRIEPEYKLELMKADQMLSELGADLMKDLGALYEKTQPDLLVVQGDTTTAFIAALTAYYHKIPVAHVEAGLRTGDIYSPFPEEVNRKAISTLAALNFAPTHRAKEQLESEGVSGVYNTGNTVIDSVILCSEIVKRESAKYEKKFSEFISEGKMLIGITAHRREQFGEGLEQICLAIKDLCTRYDYMNFVFPVHLNPSVQEKVHELLRDIDNLFLLPPLQYDEWVYIMNKCSLILTDSGGIQEEAPALDIPVIVMRDKTERPEGITAGGAVLSGTSRKSILAHFASIMENVDVRVAMQQAENPYGDGKSSERIAKEIAAFLRS